MENIQNNIIIWERRKHKKWIDNLFVNYYDYLISLNKKDVSKVWDLKHILPFLYYIEDNNLTKISIESIYNYIEYQKSKYSVGTIYNRKIALRKFLNWLYNENNINFSGNMLFPTIKNVENAKLISYYSNKEIKTIIDSMPIKTPINKRNYAIMLMLVYTGMRTKDIRELKLSSIDWNNNCINFIQSKTQSPNSIPMPKELRYALIDYLKSSRNNVDSDYVFVKNDGTIIDSYTSIINDVIEKIDFDLQGRKHGAHVFRHSLATNMLYNHEYIETIAKILGHKDIEVTVNDYIKFNEEILRKISLEVPIWK